MIANKGKTGLSILLISGMFFMSCSHTNENIATEKTNEARAFLTTKVKNTEAQKEVLLRGSVKPVNKLTLTAEIQGKAMYSTHSFEEGVYFKKGEVILSVDDTDSRYNLLASKSKFVGALNKVMSTIKLDYPDAFPAWEVYLNKMNPEHSLQILPEISDQKLRNFLVTNGIIEMYYTIKSQENQLEKYTIIAPFDGVLTATYLQKGEMVMPNMRLAEFSGTDKFEMEASVSINNLPYLQVGQSLELSNPNFEKYFTGTINRINDKLNSRTQTISVYLTIHDSLLKEGIFLEGILKTDVQQKGFAIPRKLLKRNNEVYVIRDNIVHLVSVEPLFYQGNSIYVSGLAEGEILISEVVNNPVAGQSATAK